VVTIRSVRADEAQQLRTIRLAALEADPTAFGRTHSEELEYESGHWEVRAAGSDSNQTFVAVDDGVFVGLVGAYQTEPGEPVELVSMWTAPAVRGHGIGRRLVGAVLEWADRRDVDCVELWVTRGNDAAIALYQSCGFQVTADVAPSPADPCREEIRMRRQES
jgi:ribosomal protein S18 acetylase RimI-like enzyme